MSGATPSELEPVVTDCCSIRSAGRLDHLVANPGMVAER